jgi:hypothetical protein
MRVIYLVSATMLSAIVLAMVVFSGLGRTGSSSRTAATDALSETIQGSVIALPSSGRGGGKGGGMGTKGPSAPLITIRTASGTMRVHAGPPRFHQEIGLELAQDDRIEVRGVRQGPPDRPVFIASTVTKGDRVFAIRTENGDKLWKRDQAQVPDLMTIRGHVVSLTPEVDAAAERTSSGMLIAIQTGDESLAVQLGPQKFRTDNGLTLAVGDQVEISGWRLNGAKVGQIPVMLASAITKGDRSVRVRDEQRRALWPAQ